MKLAPWGLGCLVGFACLSACSSGDDDSTGGGGSGGSGGGTSAQTLNPPPNLDASVCGTTTATPSDGSACIQCCNTHGFMASTDYDGRCVCGNPLDTAGMTVCASSAASETTCSDCCDGAAYQSYLYASFASTMSCTCSAKADASVCRSTLSEPKPNDACRVCCLNHGYLGMSYTGLGTPECDCLDT
ncbi:MAG TPA: hypothetical protein VGQ57_09625 [Polyangiaceae bacterium]|nr:hypothetical protein [Polyangiaceae bacterium]